MKRLIFPIVMLLIIILAGTLGYVFIEQWSLFNSFYMTVITIGTVGFHEVAEMSQDGRIFTVGLIIFGIGVGGYAIASLTSLIVEGHIRSLIRGKKMEKQIIQLKNHVVVCGYGKTGTEIIEELKKLKQQFVVIEKDEHKVEELKEHGQLVLFGDATEDEILEKAGVSNASGLIASLPHDADNVYVVLTAREMNPKLRIIARSIDDKSCKKLMRAGADKVVSPYSIAGRRMARLLLTPGIVDFLEVMVQSSELELKIEEVLLHKSSPFVNKQLRESNIKAETKGAMVIGIKKSDGKVIVNPPGDILLEQGITLYVIGNNAQVEKLSEMAG
ncbi:NAD-binding protein [candidate division KSB1 bacterium]|nr:NAD-binding protein [candidate division KSB1 bacterium]